MVLSCVYAFHSAGAQDETLGTVAYHTAVRVHTSSAFAYAGHFLALVNIYGRGENKNNSHD